MKYIIIILLSVILYSCSDNVTLTKEEYYKLTGDTISPKYPKTIIIDNSDWSVTLGSDGHEYVDNNGMNAYVCIHWIECAKCKNQTK